MKLHALSNIEIDNYFKDEPLYGGCYANNNLPKLENKIYIINYDDDGEKGSHWVCISNLHTDYIIYFNSFGLPPKDNVLKWIKKAKNKTAVMNDMTIQNVNSDSRGWWCIYVLNRLLKGDTLISILYDLEDNDELFEDENEDLLLEYFEDSELLK